MRVKVAQPGSKETVAKVQARPQTQPAVQRSQPRGVAAELLNLQRTHGNRFVQQLLNGGGIQRKCACGGGCPRCQGQALLQTKLKIGKPGDRYEQEADRIADQVLAAPTPAAVSAVQPRIQRYEGQQTEGRVDTAPASVDRVLASSGRPLESALQQDMEQRFGHDFSPVRVHSDPVAEQSAREVNAHAYTVGHNIVFGAGQFAPKTHGGRRLLAHELTHVVQQSGVNGTRVSQNNKARSRLPITRNPLGIGSSVNDISRVPVARIQREESADDSKPRDESLGIGEKLIIKGISAGASIGNPLLKPLIEGGFTGFYTEVRHQIKEGKGQQFMDRFKKLLVSPGDMLEYGKGYLWGILQGLWSPIQGLVDIVKLGWKLQQWKMQVLANAIQNFQEIVAMQGSLMDRFAKLGDKAKVFFGGIKDNITDFVGRLMGAISGGVFELAKTGGHKAGQAIFKFLEKPWKEIGEGVGIVVGTVLIEVLLAVFSGGIGNALTKVGQALDRIAPTLMKGVRFIASELGTIIREIRGVVETVKAGLAKAGRSLLKGMEEFIGEVGSIFDDLIAMLKKLFSGAEDAAAKLPIHAPLPVKAPTPHISAPHSPSLARPPHVETVPAKKPQAGSLAPKEPNVEVGAPKKSQVELTQPKEPPIRKTPADAVKVVEENPNVIKGEPGHRRAPVGEGHEIVEVPDSSLSSGIGCELHSLPPRIKVRCPEGMGGKGKETIEQFKQRGGEVKKLEPGKMPEKSPSEVTAVSEPKPPEGFEDLDVPSRTEKQAGVRVAEDHHVLTRYREENKKLFKDIGFKVDDDFNLIKDFKEHGELRGWQKWDPEKKVYIPQQKGHHPEYNEWATEKVKSSIKGLRGKKRQVAFQSAVEDIASIVEKYPDVLAYGPKIFERSKVLK